LEKLFEQWAGEPCLSKIRISANGSNRIYFRLQGDTKSCIGAVNKDVRENEAFFFFAREMRKRGIAVPEVYAVSDDRVVYLQQDLGNVTLYTYLSTRKASGIDITQPMRNLYMRAIDQLVLIQTKCSDIDFSYAYPRPAFDRQAVQWDLNYFKYYFLRLFHIPFDEQLLENDYQRFTDFLLDEDCGFFMYRDFQSRNIMLVDDELYFIDFQGARRGAAQYDVASLLYSSKSDVPEYMRDELLTYYIERLQLALRESDPAKADAFNPDLFRTKFYAYVLVRMMQAMGAYGFRGIIEKKELFVKSIPFAVRNLRTVLEIFHLPVEVPHLMSVLQAITRLPEYDVDENELTVSVFSFSYKKGIPFDKSGNGGGFVFDCRALPNPGRYDEYRELTGRDAEVIAFLEEHEEIGCFLDHVKALVGAAIENYQERGFTRLMVNFGCTGGRHRSVYCAEQMARFIRQNYSCRVTLHHLEQSKL